MEWEEKYKAAKKLTAERSSLKSALIEVSTFHLIDGEKPDHEFIAILNSAAQLYFQKKQELSRVQIILSAGIYKEKGKVTKISPAEAAIRFLIKIGVPREDIIGEEAREEYLKDEGVYSTADESFVAAEYYLNHQIGELYSITDPAQLLRKALHYIWFGVYPLMYATPVKESHHNYIREIYRNIPNVRDMDPTGQDKNTFYYKYTRRERKP
jgi:hypothetical protein